MPRIHFTNLGHAERCLKVCKQLLVESVEGIAPKLPRERTRNALCKGLGFNSYPALATI